MRGEVAEPLRRPAPCRARRRGGCAGVCAARGVRARLLPLEARGGHRQALLEMGAHGAYGRPGR